MKMAAPFDPITVQLATFGKSLAVVSEGLTPTMSPDEEACARLVSSNPLTHGHWKSTFDEAGLGSESTFERRRKDLVEKGIVEQFVNAMDTTVYRLTETGKETLGVNDVR
jgi:hypothetical protein